MSPCGAPRRYGAASTQRVVIAVRSSLSSVGWHGHVARARPGSRVFCSAARTDGPGTTTPTCARRRWAWSGRSGAASGEPELPGRRGSFRHASAPGEVGARAGPRPDGRGSGRAGAVISHLGHARAARPRGGQMRPRCAGHRGEMRAPRPRAHARRGQPSRRATAGARARCGEHELHRSGHRSLARGKKNRVADARADRRDPPRARCACAA